MLANHEVALLIAVSIPVAAILALNLWLFVFGERGTLLLPHLGRFPAVDADLASPIEEDAMTDQGIVVVEEEPLRKAA